MSPEIQSQIGETITVLIAFVIFFLIMKKYAWAPVTKVLDDRQKSIEEGFVKIEKRQAEADRIHKEYEERLRNIEAEARQKIQEAVAEGRRVAHEVTEAARVEARQISERAEQNMKLELAKTRLALRDELVAMTLAATEKLMRQQLDAPAQRAQVDRFLQDLQSGKPGN